MTSFRVELETILVNDEGGNRQEKSQIFCIFTAPNQKIAEAVARQFICESTARDEDELIFEVKSVAMTNEKPDIHQKINGNLNSAVLRAIHQLEEAGIKVIPDYTEMQKVIGVTTP